MSETESVTLSHPLRIAGAEVAVIRLRRPKVRDLEAMERAGEREIARSVTLIANLAELAPEDVRGMDAADFVKVSEAVAGFFPPASRA